jgi:vacuolar-type H+-ATPase subunit I/STV1
MTKDQLHSEIRKFNLRISANQATPDDSLGYDSIIDKKLLTGLSSKSKTDVLSVLLQTAKWFMEQNEEIKQRNHLSLSVGNTRSKATEEVNEEATDESEEGMICLSDSDDEEEEVVTKERQATELDESDVDDDSSLEIIESPKKDISSSSTINSNKNNRSRSGNITGIKDLLKKTALWYFGYSRFRAGQM